MIPKIIHYCWFGNKRKPALVKECIKSWKKHLPDYEIKCWTEKNLPVEHPFVKAALKSRYYAFAADFVRLFAIKQYGGIYLDTDVVVVKNFDDLLPYNFFLGEEVPGRVNLAVFGAIQNHPVINRFISFYDQIEFDPSNLPVISFSLTKVLADVKDELFTQKDMIFDPRYFYPFPYENRLENYENYICEETYAVHLWNHSWRIATDYILEKDYKQALSKIIDHLAHKKSDRFNIEYYKNLYRHFRKSLQNS